MRSQPISLEIFGDVDPEHAQSIKEVGKALSNGWIAPKQMNTLTPATYANTAGADTATYKKGDLAWYRQRDGTFVPAKVVSVDMTVHPPSYAVDLGGNVRETEAPRLRPRGPGEPAPPPPVAPPGGDNFSSVPAPLAPRQKVIASCGAPTAVSVHASSGTVPVLVNVPVAASSAHSWQAANAGLADMWRTTGAEAAAEEEDDFGDFCDADVSAASTSSSGAAVALPNSAALPQPDQQSAWFSAQPALAGMQHGSGTDANLAGFLHLPAPATLPQPPAAAAAPASSHAQVPLSFASFDAFRPVAAAHPSAGTAEPSRVACAAAGSGMSLLPGASASSFDYPPSWPAAVPDQASLCSPLHPLGPPAVANGGTEDFGDFEAADWQAYPASSAACAASGPADAHLNSKPEEAARKAEAGTNGGGRGVTPASTIDIAREELDFSEASDEDDFGDFEDAVSGNRPAGAPAAAGAPTLDRSAPLPMSLFGEETDPVEASPPLPSLDLAAPWGGLGFSQGPINQAPPATDMFPPVPALALPSQLPDQAHPSSPASILALPSQAPDQAHPPTPLPTLALPSQAPDLATLSQLGSAAAAQLPVRGVLPTVFPACAPATPMHSEHTPCAADVTPLPAPALSAQWPGMPPAAAAARDAAADAAAAVVSGMSETATTSTRSDALSEGDAEAGSDARRDTGAEVFADAQLAAQASVGEPKAASSGETAADSATVPAEGNRQGSEEGINWDALDFSFADDVPEQARQAPKASLDAPPNNAQHGQDTPAESPETAQPAGPIRDAVDEHSMPSGAIGQEEAAEKVAAVTAAALVVSLQTQDPQAAEQQMAAEDEEAEDWGEFEEFPAAEDSADVTAESTEASHWDHTWSGEPTESSSGATEWLAESVIGPDHAHELAQFPVSAAPGASAGVPSSSAAADRDFRGSAVMMWPAESAAREQQTVSSAELALQPGSEPPQPSAGVPSRPAALDWDLLNGYPGGGSSSVGAERAPMHQPQEAEDAGGGWDADDSWLVAEAEMRPALPSADLWNALASCDPGNPATELQRGVGSVAQGDDIFDEGLWGKDWAAAGSSGLGAGSPNLLLVQPHAATASGTFAGHDRAVALRLLAKAAEAELAEGQRIWSEACSGGCQASFCAGAAERQYITALGAVYFVACALRGGCAIGGVDDAAIAGSLTRCQECWHGKTPGMSALKTAYEAATAEAEPCQLSVVLDEACNLLGASTGLDEEGRRKVGPCCAITCLPLTLCPAVPAVQIEGGSCWVKGRRSDGLALSNDALLQAPVANLWANRVQPALQDAQ